jgi:paraquat-inducible protein A
MAAIETIIPSIVLRSARRESPGGEVNDPQRRGETVACPHCDLLQDIPPLPPGGTARCARCASTIATRSTDPIDRPLALTFAALFAFIVANTEPLMGLSAAGRHASTTIVNGAYEMWMQGQQITALVIAFCAVIAPGGYILFLLTVLLAVRRPPAPRWVGELLRWAAFMQPWSMVEVMILGILIALIKIAELALVDPGIGMYAVGALVVLLTAIGITFDSDEIWRRIEWVDPQPSVAGVAQATASPEARA